MTRWEAVVYSNIKDGRGAPKGPFNVCIFTRVFGFQGRTKSMDKKLLHGILVVRKDFVDMPQEVLLLRNHLIQGWVRMQSW